MCASSGHGQHHHSAAKANSYATAAMLQSAGWIAVAFFSTAPSKVPHVLLEFVVLPDEVQHLCPQLQQALLLC